MSESWSNEQLRPVLVGPGLACYAEVKGSDTVPSLLASALPQLQTDLGLLSSLCFSPFFWSNKSKAVRWGSRDLHQWSEAFNWKRLEKWDDAQQYGMAA